MSQGQGRVRAWAQVRAQAHGLGHGQYQQRGVTSDPLTMIAGMVLERAKSSDMNSDVGWQ